jgi:hypothetical protein
MNLFRTALRRASVKMSLKKLRKARKMAIRRIGIPDQASVESEKPQTDRQAGPGSVRDWADAMQVRAPKKITTFIRRKLRY